MLTNVAPSMIFISCLVKHFPNFPYSDIDGGYKWFWCIRKLSRSPSLDWHATYKFAYRWLSAWRLTTSCLDLLVTIEFLLRNNGKFFFLIVSYIDFVSHCILSHYCSFLRICRIFVRNMFRDNINETIFIFLKRIS